MTILRPFHDNDAPLIARYCADYDLAKMTARIPHPYLPELADEFVAFSQGPESRNWAITEDGDALVGMIGSSKAEDTADVGYWIGAPFGGRGHATRALRLLIEKVFEDTDIRTLTACVFQDNPASAQVLKKTGFEQSADCAGKSIARGPGTYPIWTFALNRSAWEAAS